VAAAGPAVVLDADPLRIREVLANLVVNAVRHTQPGGSIRLDAAVDGAWVGLTVARDLVTAHGGTIRAESAGTPGRGTTFRVRLPRRD